jgi:hypothetical protein
MRMTEAILFPVIPYLCAQGSNQEVKSMSDYVHTSSRSKPLAESKTIESRLMFGVFYMLFLFRAAATRLMPWRKQNSFGPSNNRESIFIEARSAAGTIVTSSFMGL